MMRMGILSDIIDAYGKTTHYVNDARGNVLSETDPLGHTTTYDYDANDNLKESDRSIESCDEI